MSAEQALQPAEGSFTLDPRARHVLRYALGATLAMALAMAGGAIPIPLADLAAVTAVQLDMLKRLAGTYAVQFDGGTAVRSFHGGNFGDRYSGHTRSGARRT